LIELEKIKSTWSGQDEYELHDQHEYQQKIEMRETQVRMWREDESKVCSKQKHERVNKEDSQRLAQQTYDENIREFTEAKTAAGNDTSAITIGGLIVQTQKRWEQQLLNYEREERKVKELNTKEQENWSQKRIDAKKASEEENTMRSEARQKWYADHDSKQEKPQTEEQKLIVKQLTYKTASNEHLHKSAENMQKSREQMFSAEEFSTKSSANLAAAEREAGLSTQEEQHASELTSKAQEYGTGSNKSAELLAEASVHISNSSQYSDQQGEKRESSAELSVKAQEASANSQENKEKSAEQKTKADAKEADATQSAQHVVVIKEGVEKVEAEKGQKAEIKAAASVALNARTRAASLNEKSVKVCQTSERVAAALTESQQKMDASKERAQKADEAAAAALNSDVSTEEMLAIANANDTAHANMSTTAGLTQNAEAAATKAGEGCEEAQTLDKQAQDKAVALETLHSAALKNLTSQSVSKSPDEFETDVTLGIAGIDAATFDENAVSAMQAAIALSLNIETSQVKISSVQDASSEQQRLSQNLGDTVQESGVTVPVTITSKSKSAAMSQKSAIVAKAEDSGAAGLMKTFSAQAAAVGFTVPGTAKVSSVEAVTKETKADGTVIPVENDADADISAQAQQNAEAVKAALEAVREANAAKAKADTLLYKLKGPYEKAREAVVNAKEGLADSEKSADDATKAVAQAKEATAEAGVKAAAQQGKVQAANDAHKTAAIEMDTYTNKQIAAEKDAATSAAKAEELWAAYLKAFADQSSEDAKAKVKTDLTDPWTKIMAEAAKPQENGDGADCSSVGKKFQQVIYLARDEFMEKAKQQCVAEGHVWKESRADRRQLADSDSVLDETPEFKTAHEAAKAQVEN